MVEDTVKLACFILILSSVDAFADEGNMSELQRLLRTKHLKTDARSPKPVVKQELPFVAKSRKNRIVWSDWEEMEKPENWHKHMIRDWYQGPRNQDDPIANLLQTMLTFDKNGRPHMPKGIDPSKKASAKAENEDNHFFSKADGKRNFAERVTLWEYAYIPYYIDPTFDSAQRKTILVGIKEFTDKTCIRFVPKEMAAWSALPHQTYINFTSDSTSCNSYVGRIRTGSQTIGLNKWKCINKKTVVHEIMHALGQVHEQQRKDRDQHIIMHWNNVIGGRNNKNMEILSIGSHDRTQYDPTSSLQYSLKAFTSNQQKTMSFRDSTLESLVGSSSGLTHLDVREITQAYNCAGHCTNRVYCRNGGFVGADCTCVCPDGLSGTECQQVVGDPDCGGVVSLDAVDYVDLKSPNFPNRYPTDKVCTVILTAPTGSNIALDVVDNKMNLKQSTIDNSCSHWLEVRYVSPEIMGPKFCTPFKRIVSKSNTLMMRFDSRFSKDEYPYSNQMFHLRASTGGAGPSIQEPGFDKSCNFDTAENCWMLMRGVHIIRDAFSAGMNPPNGGKGTPGYAFINTQTNFILQTPSGTLDGEYCLTLSFYMRGSSVYFGIYKAGPGWLWSTSDPGNVWKSLTMTFTCESSSYMVIYGHLGSSGLVAVDQVRIQNGRCH
eukprot:XP_011455943.2 PREDICTED: zinc metalloproteinase nas-23 [Crassostrea gigas]